MAYSFHVVTFNDQKRTAKARDWRTTRTRLKVDQPNPKTIFDVQSRWRIERLAPLAIALLGLALYTAGVPGNPPGFYLDESSIAFNAHSIAATGHDEYGEAWPLFFRAFGEYKNPVYVYLLAAIFKITGPGITAARMTSAVLGVATALLLGRLAGKLSGRKAVSVLVSLSALLTPWLYENSRLVFEVAIYPLALTIFLLALHRASGRAKWSATDVLSLAASLALLTYSYSIGRLFAPMLALGLAFFTQRGRRANVLIVWLVYGLSVTPLLFFQWRHPGALTARFMQLTYLTSQGSIYDATKEFLFRYATAINPVRLLLIGEDNIRDHFPGKGSLLVVTFGLAVVGLSFVLQRHRSDPWWRFMLYALVTSIVPAALTTSVFPQIRLVGLPVLLHVFTVPAWLWLLRQGEAVGGGARTGRVSPARRPFLALIVFLTVAQGLYFQWLFHWRPPARGYVFDESFPRKILSPALQMRGHSRYLYDPPGRSGYIQAYWHGLLSGADISRFARLQSDSEAPPGSIVISTAEECANCRVLVRHINYILYSRLPSDLRPQVGALAADAFRAEVKGLGVPDTLRTGEKLTLSTLVRNMSGVAWPSVGDDDGRYVITLRNRWRKDDGVGEDDSRQAIHYGLDPGDVAGVSMLVTAPVVPGVYSLEIDVVQEGVAWFSDRGSQQYRKKVLVVP